MSTLTEVNQLEQMPDTTRAALCYLPIVNLICYLTNKDDKFVRFHALQSIFLDLFWIVVVIVFTVMFAIAGPGFEVVEMGVRTTPSFRMLSNVYTIVRLFILAVTIGCMVLAYNGIRFKIPGFGNLADRVLSK